MREPATSCTTCGAALLPAEVLYSPQADVVCAACFGGLPDARRVPASGGHGASVRTARERRGAILRWSLLFAILAASSLQVRHFAVIRLLMICPRVSIDAPGFGAVISPHLVVRGHVVSTTVTRPLWVVACAVAEWGGCLDVRSAPVITDPFGVFAVPLDLPGHRDVRYVISVVSVDQAVDGGLRFQADGSYGEARRRDPAQQGGPGRCRRWNTLEQRSLPEGAAVLASVGVSLGEDQPSSLFPASFPSTGLEDDGALLDAEP